MDLEGSLPRSKGRTNSEGLCNIS